MYTGEQLLFVRMATFVSTVGVNESIIKRYVENQGKEDSGQAQLVLGFAD